MPAALLFALISPLAAIGFGVIIFRWVLAKPQGDDKMLSVARAIQGGAAAYLLRQARSVIPTAAVITILLIGFLNVRTAVAFLVGATLAGIAGLIGMQFSARAGARAAEAAKSGQQELLDIAWRSGSATGLAAIGIGLLGIAAYYAVTRDTQTLFGLGLGGSLISVFGRLGGGIFAEAADAGADLVAKAEVGLSGNELRNPAAIAALVGGNISVTTDIFETYALAAIAAMLLGNLVFDGSENAILYPLALSGISIIASVIGVFAARLGTGQNITTALHKALAAASVIAAILYYPATTWLMPQNGHYGVLGLYLSSLIGIAISAVILAVAGYGGSAGSPRTDRAGNMIAGLPLSWRVTATPVLAICFGVLAAYGLAGLYGIAVASVAMLSLGGVVIGFDALRANAGNAGGIAKISGLPDGIRETLGRLEIAAGSMKAAVGAYTISAAGLAAILLFGAYAEELIGLNGDFTFSIAEPKVIVGLLLGSLLISHLAGGVLRSAGRAAAPALEEVRRQLREIRGIAEGAAQPDYAKSVDVVAKAAISEMAWPAVALAASPLVVGLLFRRLLGPEALGGLLLGAVICGMFTALSLAASGSVRKNSGDGARGTQDPTGAAIGPMIKGMSVIALLIAGMLVG